MDSTAFFEQGRHSRCRIESRAQFKRCFKNKTEAPDSSIIAQFNGLLDFGESITLNASSNEVKHAGREAFKRYVGIHV